MWSFVNNELVGVAFIDTLIYIHSLAVIKNFILYADITKSLSLLTFDKDCKTLSVVSRDFEPMEIYKCDFVVDGQNLGFIVSDSNTNLVIYLYQVSISIRITKTTAAQNEVALSYHRLRGLYFLAVILRRL